MMAPPTAVQLKDEGNALFAKKDFVRAHEKYTEAIAVDGQSAILYANRSACSYGMGKYVDALYDAHQATEIDPGYAKGWSRLATAHEAALEFTSAIKAWKKALGALPKENLTPVELKQKEQYTTSLQKSRNHLEAYSSRPFPGIMTNEITEKQPWQVAEEMLPELQAAGRAKYPSSAYLIHHANQEFAEGVKHMKSLKVVPMKDAPDGHAIFGHTSGLTCLTNGVMRDIRVFRMDCQDWIEKYNRQVCFEAEKYQAWLSESLETIQREALERLKKKGWDDVRPALATVVRAWIMRAIFDSQLRQASHIAIERLKETLQLLHWGRQVWRDVTKGDRGVVFESTFVRGVKVIYLEALLEMHARASDVDKPGLLEILLQESRELIQETERNPAPLNPSPGDFVDPGFVSSFYVYPAATAYAMAGYCFIQLGRSSPNPAEQKTLNVLAVKQYVTAAYMLPEDDEKHCWYLQCTIDPMLRAGAPENGIRDIVNGIRSSMPQMQRIWANSALAKGGRDAMIETALRLAEKK